MLVRSCPGIATDATSRQYSHSSKQKMVLGPYRGTLPGGSRPVPFGRKIAFYPERVVASVMSGPEGPTGGRRPCRFDPTGLALDDTVLLCHNDK